MTIEQTSRFVLVAAIALFTARVGAAEATSYSVIYSFKGTPDGGAPKAGVAFGKNGALYGTTYQQGQNGCGTVYELAPVASNKWTETLLHSFCATSGDGSNPQANLVLNSQGALFGTTLHGGTNGTGTIFELTEPGVWRPLDQLGDLQLWWSREYER
jgi:uncharacterized repeat protein (TIGR03803 family)